MAILKITEEGKRHETEEPEGRKRERESQIHEKIITANIRSNQFQHKTAGAFAKELALSKDVKREKKCK